MKVVFYTIGCPSCRVLELKLKKAGISYDTVADADVMREKGFKSAPILEVDGEVMAFDKAIAWVNQRMGK